MTTRFPTSPADPLMSEWERLERAAAPEHRALLLRARRQIEAEIEDAGAYALGLPNISDLIAKRVAVLRETLKAAKPHAAPAEGVKRWITINEAAEFIGMSPGFVRDHLLQGDTPGITGVKHGDSWRVDAMALGAYLERRDTAA